MKISVRWLARHVDLSGLSAEELANDLTIHTAEVEGVEPFAPWLADVVVGHVVERVKHPDADKLSVCKVDVGSRGEGSLLQIVCGAANVAAGQKVAVALPGTTLPGDLKLKKTKIRGVESLGMICSERELALGEDQAGIWVLAGDLTLGVPLSEALGADWVIEIDNKSLTHRPDLWGHRGIAGEIAAIRKRPLKPLALDPLKTGSGAPYPVRVETEGCSRYIGLPIEGIRAARAPEWMRMLLLAVGQRPIDLFVDVSNFVMLDLAQPNHLFDLERLSSEGIVVRDARAGERMATLDGIERTFTSEDMLICSGADPVAVAGVMGGELSKVAPGTSNLLLEVASFHPTRVRRTAARINLRTDASTRFEKHLDPTLPAKAAAHLVALLRSIQPELRLPRPAGDAGSWKDPARRVKLRPERVRAVLGAEIPDEEIGSILTALGFGLQRGATWEVSVPSARATKDVTIEEDLIEEVGRMHGYGSIPERALEVELRPTARDERHELVVRLTERLGGAARFHEALTYSFVDRDLAGLLGVADEPRIPIVNPQIELLDSVRRSVAPSLLAHLAKNRRARAEVRLFEIGKGYRPERLGSDPDPLQAEVHELALVWMAPRAGKEARFDERVFAWLQGVVEDLCRDAGVDLAPWTRVEPESAPRWAHSRRTMASGGEAGTDPVALVASLDPEVQQRLGLIGELDGEVACATLSIDRMLSVRTAGKSRYRPLPRFPGTKVDVALALAEECPAGAAEEKIRAAGKGLVEDVELFDLYRGPSVGPGKKSLAYHVALRAADRTLDEQDAAKFLTRLERAIGELGGELRKE